MNLAAVIALALEWGTPAAAAQADPYGAAIDTALAEYDRGNFVEALAAFERAYELRPGARVLRGIGKVRFELRQYVEAIDAFDRALRSDVEPLTEEMRVEVESLRDRARGFVGRLLVRVTPASARVTVDGRARRAGAPFDVEVGERLVEVGARGFQSARRVVEVSPQVTTSLEIALDSATTLVRVERDETLLVVDSILGVVFVGATIAAALWLGDRLGAVDRCEAEMAEGTTCRNASTLRLERDGALASLIASGVATATSAVFFVWLLSDPPSSEDGLAGRGVVCGGSIRF